MRSTYSGFIAPTYLGGSKNLMAYLFLYLCSFQTTVVDATSALREKLTEFKGLAAPAQYGLFLADEDPKKGVWLDPSRTLEHYLLRENVSGTF